MKRTHFFLISLFMFTCISKAAIYVDQDAKGYNNGSSWTHAYIDLQDALEEAWLNPEDIWVAEGTYTPSYKIDPGDDRSATFRLINDVAVYGGFDPDAGVTAFKDRKPVIYVCILSGDIGIKGSKSDNCYHILYHPAAISVNTTAVLDGFTLENGYANGLGHYGRGAAVYNVDNSPGFINCQFQNNTAISDGGAVYNTNNSEPGFLNCFFYDNQATSTSNGGAVCNINSAPTFNGCVFDKILVTGGNTAYFGGGMYNDGSSPYLVDCDFYDCEAEDGGAIYNDNASPTITDCTFSQNTVSGASTHCRGGAIANLNGSSPTISGGLFDFNIALGAAQGKGGAIYCDATSSPHISGTVFDNNASHDNGGGIYCNGSSPIIDSHAVLINNTALNGSGGAIYCINSASPTLTDCTIEQNDADENAGGIYCDDSTVLLTRCDILSNESQWNGAGLAFLNSSGGTIADCNIVDNMTTIADQMGGGIYCNLSSPTITNTTLSGNSTKIGGGIACDLNASPTLTNCRIINNTASYDAGAVFANDSSNPVLINCILADNTVIGDAPGYRQGGAMYLANSSAVTLKNCTISNNTAAGSTGGIYTFSATAILTNSIVWGNSGTQLDSGSSAAYCDVEGGFTGTGNIDQNPLFVDAANGDYHLQQSSLCVDAGSNAAASGIPTDIDGDNRIIDGDGDTVLTVDMGADEAPEMVSVVWVDDDYTAGGANDGHTWGYNAFAVIQDGIDALSAGGAVNVAAGIYFENLELAKDLTLQGAGPWQTFIDGNDLGEVIFALNVSSNTQIDGFTITNGTGRDLGGGLLAGGGLLLDNSSLVMSHCIIRDNTAQYGGGLDNENTASPTVVNCLFVNNTAEYGGAVDSFNNCQPVFINCTFAQNTAAADGHALYNENNCSVTVTNCVLWDTSINEIYNDGTSSTTVNYSNVRGGWPGTNNLDTDPLFLNPPAEDFRLSYDSDCVEAGSNAAIPIAFSKDLDNTQRIAADNCNYNPIIDIGAYEFKRQRVGDFNDDCQINLIDFSTLASYWLTDEYQADIAPPYANGLVDSDDLMYFVEHWLEAYN